MLVRIETSAANLSIGLGHPEASVALYLDADGRPWHASDETNTLNIDGPSFSTQHGTSDFFATAALSQNKARRIVRDFAQSPDQMPSGVTWLPEGETPS